MTNLVVPDKYENDLRLAAGLLGNLESVLECTVRCGVGGKKIRIMDHMTSNTPFATR